jgi:DsbC/DsbD-like thiol-disulfide interchange protein
MRILMMRLLLPIVLLLVGMSIPIGTVWARSVESASPALALPESAQVSTVIEDDEPQLRARLLVSRDPSPQVGVLFDLAPGWHLYWRNPGETGIAPSLGLEASSHRIGDVAWPAPRTFREADGLFTTYGYEKSVLLVAPIEAVDENSVSGVIRANTSVLVCRTQCVPASFTLSTPLDTGLSEEAQSVVDALFRDANATVPIAAAELGLEASATWTDKPPEPDETGRLELVVRSCRQNSRPCQSSARDSEDTRFIPMEGATFEFSSACLIDNGLEVGGFTLAMEAIRLEAG